MSQHDRREAAYGVQVKCSHEQVRRNIARFPEAFMFQLTKNELINLLSQNATQIQFSHYIEINISI
ncbi:MAG: ORF6N domain-containing protein [Candidatus Margulisbacteria bacterium]|nr:ORF6N domain-containing protein [Candidatus Margulisiibacteriota bacterium]